MEYHLLNRKIETSGLLQQCREMGVKIIAYSPLAQGILTGKYTPQNLPRGFRGQRYNRSYLERVTPLVSLLKKIGADHERQECRAGRLELVHLQGYAANTRGQNPVAGRAELWCGRLAVDRR